MALNLVEAKLDGVPEAMRSLYIEKDGQFHLDVTGVEDVTGLKSALGKERDAAKDAKRMLADLQKQFEGIDPTKVRDMLKHLDNSEEAKLLAEGKLDDVVAKRTEKLRGELQRQLDEAGGKVKAADDRASKFSQRVLDNHIRAAATKAGVHAQAIDDALIRGRSIFTLDENGDPVQMDNDGKAVLGKDGKTLFSPVEWLESMKEAAPHWFPAGAGGSGASGSGGGSGSAKQMKRTAFDSLDAAAKREALKNGTKIID